MEGEVKVTTPEGEVVEFGAGDLVTFPAGSGAPGTCASRSASTIASVRCRRHSIVRKRGRRQTMAALETPAGDLGWQAEDFTLEDAYGNFFRLSDLKGPSGTLVMFICNHCPYVRAIADRIVRDALDLQKRGVSVIAVMPNDYARYPDDAPEQMKRFAKERNFSFPYVIDETQEVARAYDAVCTPDFFGFNAALKLQYRGRLDASRTTLVRMPDASCSRRCARSPRPARVRRSSRRAWAARSSGGSNCRRYAPCTACSNSLPRPSIFNLVPFRKRGQSRCIAVASIAEPASQIISRGVSTSVRRALGSSERTRRRLTAFATSATRTSIGSLNRSSLAITRYTHGKFSRELRPQKRFLWPTVKKLASSLVQLSPASNSERGKLLPIVTYLKFLNRKTGEFDVFFRTNVGS